MHDEVVSLSFFMCPQVLHDELVGLSFSMSHRVLHDELVSLAFLLHFIDRRVMIRVCYDSMDCLLLHRDD